MTNEALENLSYNYEQLSFLDLSLFGRKTLKDVFYENEFGRIKYSKSRGDNPDKYQVQVMFRERKYPKFYGDEPRTDVFDISKNSIVMGVRGKISNNGFILGPSDFEKFDYNVLLKSGINVKERLNISYLKEEINYIAENYRKNFVENFSLFMKDSLEVIDDYIVKNI